MCTFFVSILLFVFLQPVVHSMHNPPKINRTEMNHPMIFTETFTMSHHFGRCFLLKSSKHPSFLLHFGCFLLPFKTAIPHRNCTSSVLLRHKVSCTCQFHWLCLCFISESLLEGSKNQRHWFVIMDPGIPSKSLRL